MIWSPDQPRVRARPEAHEHPLSDDEVRAHNLIVYAFADALKLAAAHDHFLNMPTEEIQEMYTRAIRALFLPENRLSLTAAPQLFNIVGTAPEAVLTKLLEQRLQAIMHNGQRRIHLADLDKAITDVASQFLRHEYIAAWLSWWEAKQANPQITANSFALPHLFWE